MKLSEAIAQLEALRARHGDIELSITMAEYYEGECGDASSFVLQQFDGEKPKIVPN